MLCLPARQIYRCCLNIHFRVFVMLDTFAWIYFFLVWLNGHTDLVDTDFQLSFVKLIFGGAFLTFIDTGQWRASASEWQGAEIKKLPWVEFEGQTLRLKPKLPRLRPAPPPPNSGLAVEWMWLRSGLHRAVVPFPEWAISRFRNFIFRKGFWDFSSTANQITEFCFVG